MAISYFVWQTNLNKHLTIEYFNAALATSVVLRTGQYFKGGTLVGLYKAPAWWQGQICVRQICNINEMQNTKWPLSSPYW